MTSACTVIVPTMSGASRLRPLLASLREQMAGHELIVVDNASADPELADLPTEFPGARVIRLERNAGFSRAVNLAAEQAAGSRLILINDDCVCDPGFVEAIGAAIDPGAGVDHGGLGDAGPGRPRADRQRRHAARPHPAVFDYLNGQPLSLLDGDVADPIGPSAAAAAFDREAFIATGGFDEGIFAYWEDVDLVIRMRRLGGRCVLARGARGTHEHSASLGSGSARKNYLMGFGRGYVLRKWRVLNARRLAPVLARELVICGGQAVVDRNVAGLRGRVRGYRAASPGAGFPAEIGLESRSWELLRTLGARARRRARLRQRGGADASASPTGAAGSR